MKRVHLWEQAINEHKLFETIHWHVMSVAVRRARAGQEVEIQLSQLVKIHGLRFLEYSRSTLNDQVESLAQYIMRATN